MPTTIAVVILDTEIQLQALNLFRTIINDKSVFGWVLKTALGADLDSSAATSDPQIARFRQHLAQEVVEMSAEVDSDEPSPAAASSVARLLDTAPLTAIASRDAVATIRAATARREASAAAAAAQQEAAAVDATPSPQVCIYASVGQCVSVHAVPPCLRASVPPCLHARVRVQVTVGTQAKPAHHCLRLTHRFPLAVGEEEGLRAGLSRLTTSWA